MTALDVLLLSNGPATLADVAADLEAAGHRVHRCHEPASPAAWPCASLDGHPCPLETGIDVAVDVRTAVSSGTSPWEDGVACARREGVPLVLAGRTSLHPFGDHASVVVEDTHAIVGAVQLAAEKAQAAREAEIEAVCGAPVTLTREGSIVHVEVHGTREVTGERTTLAARAGAAARARYPHATHVTVGLSSPLGA